MPYSVAEIAAALGAKAEGDVSLIVSRPAEPQSAGADDLAVAMDQKYLEQLARGHARAALLRDGTNWRELGLKAAILVSRPRLAMSALTRRFDEPDLPIDAGIHPTAVIGPDATLGPDATVGPFVVIGAGAVIGPRARIGSHASVAPGARIGADFVLHAGARVHRNVTIADRVLVHHNAVIGADGFSFVTPERSGVEAVRETLGHADGATEGQPWLRIHSLGGVHLSDEVEVGAVATIDAGTIRATEVGARTKIDDHVHIGHNVRIGTDCLICGHVGVAGSAVVGNNVVLGGQVGVADNIFVGDNVIAGGGTKIMSNVPAGRVVLGYPAQKMDGQIELYKALRRLPRLFAQVAELQKAVSKTGKTD